MRFSTIEDFLGQLADRVPAPGGGAVAALHAAQAASLLAMVARYSDGAKYERNEAAITHIRNRADQLRETCLELAEQDVAAFGTVSDAYGLPKDTQSDKAARRSSIAVALLTAAEPPAGVIVASAELIELAEQLTPMANPNVITDVGAAADATRAAATTARLNVEINLAGIVDPPARQRFLDMVASVDDVARRADHVHRVVRSMISS